MVVSSQLVRLQSLPVSKRETLFRRDGPWLKNEIEEQALAIPYLAVLGSSACASVPLRRCVQDLVQLIDERQRALERDHDVANRLVVLVERDDVRPAARAIAFA